MREHFLNITLIFKSRFLLSFFVSAAVILGANGCNLFEGCNTDVNKIVKPEIGEGVGDLSQTLISRLPETTFGFVYWDNSHPSYKKLSTSPWSTSTESGSQFLDSLSKQDVETRRIIKTLKEGGLDLSNSKTVGDLFKKGAVFSAVSKEEDSEIAVGIVFEAKNETEISTAMAAVRNGLTKNGETTDELELEKGNGFKITTKRAGSTDVSEVFLAWIGNVGVMSSAKWAVEVVTKSSLGKFLPITTKDQFKRATEKLPGDSYRYLLGFVDFSYLTEKLHGKVVRFADIPWIMKKEMPLQAISFAFGMKETPLTELRFVYNKDNQAMTTALEGLKASSSGRVAKLLPENQMLFLSVDANSLQLLIKTILSELAMPAEAFDKQFQTWGQLDRISVAARLAPVGQSLLPIPDILLLGQSESSADLKLLIIQTLSGLMQFQSIEKKIAKVVVTILRGPGFGVFIGNQSDVVFVSSTEQSVTSAITVMDGDGGAFTNTLPELAKETLTERETVANLYVNFVQVSKFLESMGGVLSLYAPQSEEAKKLLDEQTLGELKKMGSMIGSVTLDKAPGYIRVRGSYNAPKPVKQP